MPQPPLSGRSGPSLVCRAPPPLGFSFLFRPTRRLPRVAWSKRPRRVSLITAVEAIRYSLRGREARCGYPNGISSRLVTISTSRMIADVLDTGHFSERDSKEAINAGKSHTLKYPVSPCDNNHMQESRFSLAFRSAISHSRGVVERSTNLEVERCGSERKSSC